MTTAIDGPAAGRVPPSKVPSLVCRIRLADGRALRGRLPAARHRKIHIGLLHSGSEGFVEICAGTRPVGGPLELDRRALHFLPAGHGGGPAWLRRADQHARRIVDGAYLIAEEAGERADGRWAECFIGVTARTGKRGTREHVALARWLWVDVDDTANLERLYAFLAERPCHLLVESAGSGGVHCYWKLARPLPATLVDPDTAEVTAPIERANLRLIAAVGADPQCADRNRVLRLAGSPNGKSGRWARIVHADLHLAPYRARELVGDLPDPVPAVRPTRTGDLDRTDPYRQIPATVYFARLARLKPNRGGYVACPSPAHADRHPSCRVGGPEATLFKCFACGVGGGIYDLASLVLGGPTGRALREENFKAAKTLVADTFGESPRAAGDPRAATRPRHKPARPAKPTAEAKPTVGTKKGT